MPADSAFGAGVTPVCPTSRGQAGCGAFRLGRVWEQTATGSRAGACRLRWFLGRWAGSAGGQCRWRGGDACLPHAPGADRLRCVSLGAGVGADGDRLTSRSLSPAARWATLPCPGGARGAAGVRIRRCLPLRGKDAAEYGAPDHGFIAGESCLRGGLPLNGGRAARPGDGSMPSCAPWDRRVHEVIPQGERRALPAPAQGSRPLRIPFWEAASIFPSPVPQNAADGKPLLVGLPSSMRTTAPSGTKRSASAPCSWGGCASTRRRRLRPPALPAASTRSRRLWLPTLSASAWAVVLASAWPR